MTRISLFWLFDCPSVGFTFFEKWNFNFGGYNQQPRNYRRVFFLLTERGENLILPTENSSDNIISTEKLILQADGDLWNWRAKKKERSIEVNTFEILSGNCQSGFANLGSGELNLPTLENCLEEVLLLLPPPSICPRQNWIKNIMQFWKSAA